MIGQIATLNGQLQRSLNTLEIHVRMLPTSSTSQAVSTSHNSLPRLRPGQLRADQSLRPDQVITLKTVLSVQEGHTDLLASLQEQVNQLSGMLSKSSKTEIELRQRVVDAETLAKRLGQNLTQSISQQIDHNQVIQNELAQSRQALVRVTNLHQPQNRSKLSRGRSEANPDVELILAGLQPPISFPAVTLPNFQTEHLARVSSNHSLTSGTSTFTQESVRTANTYQDVRNPYYSNTPAGKNRFLVCYFRYHHTVWQKQ